MTALRHQQGIVSGQHPEPSTPNQDQIDPDVFAISPNGFTDDGKAISAHKLMLSIMESDFKLAQQHDDHLAGSVRKEMSKFPRITALLVLLELVGAIASKLLPHINFEEGNFSRTNLNSTNFISLNFIDAARQAVENFVSSLIIIDSHPVIYIEKTDVDRAYILYNYMELTTRMLFNVSNIIPFPSLQDDRSLDKQLTRK